MKRYRQRKKKTLRKIVISIIMLLVMFYFSVIFFDRKVMPSVLEIAKTTMKNNVTQIISEVSMEVFNEVFGKKEVLEIGRNSKGDIDMIKPDTAGLNKMNALISVRCNEKIKAMNDQGIDVPLGWMTDRSVFYDIGPNVRVDVDPLGNVDTKFQTSFEGQGINQTKYKVKLDVTATIKIIIPMYSEEVKISSEVPLTEIVVVGNIPNTSIGLND